MWHTRPAWAVRAEALKRSLDILRAEITASDDERRECSGCKRMAERMEAGGR
jgi:hypothetical protein